MHSFSPRTSSLRSGVLVAALSLAALSAAAQDPAQAPAPTQPPAPVVRQNAPAYHSGQNQRPAPPQIATTSPSPGIWVRSGPGAEVKTVSTTADAIELRVDKGLANVTLRHPKENEQILVDLPGGQVALEKDGIYTFNAATNTFRVLEGEAAAYPAADGNAKPLTVKEDHAVVFGSGNLRATEFAPFQARADILPTGPEGRGEPGYGPGPGYGRGYYGAGYYGGPGPATAYGPAYAYGPYGDGYYPYAPYPSYAWGYPYSPWGWGYPYFGVGIGFGGYWGGGFGRGFGIRR